jgi:hypothetical protein
MKSLTSKLPPHLGIYASLPTLFGCCKFENKMCYENFIAQMFLFIPVY